MEDTRCAYAVFFLSRTGEMMALLFIPLLGLELGLSLWEVGIIVASYQLANLISHTLFGWASDKVGRRKPFVVAGCLASSAVFWAHLAMSDFSSMLAIRFGAGLAIGAVFYPLIAYASSSQRFEKPVGLLSSMGSLGWLAGDLAAGLIGRYDLIFEASAALLLLASALSLFIEESPAPRSHRIVKAQEVFRRGRWLYTSYFLRHLAAYNIWAVFPIYLSMLGASKLWIGILYALNMGTQVLAMNIAGFLAEGGKEKQLVRAGILLSAAVFTTYWLSQSYLQVAPAQVLLGFAWGFLYVGSLIYLIRRSPEERATATGILGSTISAAAVSGSFLGGAVAEVFSPRENTLLGVFLALLALIASLRI